MRKAFLYALKRSLPVLVSFFPVGFAYGILMQATGYNWVWTGFTSLFVFAGSLQYLMVTFFAGGVSLITVAVMALLLNSRHIFYGIPFIEKWRKYGFWKYVLIFLLPDEAFSIHISNDFDDGNETHKKFSYVFTAVLIYSYWFVFTIAGAVFGSVVDFNTDGIDFAMTAMFVVILVEQLREKGSRLPALIASVSAIVCLVIIGPDKFILPALMITVVILSIFKKKLEVPEQ